MPLRGREKSGQGEKDIVGRVAEAVGNAIQQQPEIQALVKELVEQIALKGAAVARPGKTFKQLADAWMAVEGVRYVEPKNEERHIRHLVSLWEMTEATLTPRLVRSTLVALAKPIGQLGTNTVNKCQATARRIIRWAQIEGEWGPLNPFGVVPRLKETKPVHEFVNISECRAFLPWLRPDRRRMALTMLFLGARPGELIALRKGDVDTVRRELVIRRSRSRDQTKTGTERRMPIPDELFAALVEAIEASPSDHVFVGADGGKMRDDTKLSRCLQHAFRQAGLVTAYEYHCNKKGCGFKETRPTKESRRCPHDNRRLLICGVPKRVRFYDLRHSAATLHREAGCDPRVIQIVLGHRARNTTDDIYTHVSDQYVRLELNRLSLYKADALNT